jgi:hypothetical protein
MDKTGAPGGTRLPLVAPKSYGISAYQHMLVRAWEEMDLSGVLALKTALAIEAG